MPPKKKILKKKEADDAQQKFNERSIIRRPRKRQVTGTAKNRRVVGIKHTPKSRQVASTTSIVARKRAAARRAGGKK